MFPHDPNESCMTAKRPPGLFIAGTDTEVGKTYVASQIITALRRAPLRVGAYKPVASGCRIVSGAVVSDDAMALWEASGRNGALDWVCPQRFLAPVAPSVAARLESREVDAGLLRSGIDVWCGTCDVVIVEGAGGLMSPLHEKTFNADLAKDLGYPLVIVAHDRLGAMNQVLQSLLVAETIYGLRVAAVVLNQARSPQPEDLGDRLGNAAALRSYCDAPVVSLSWNAQTFDPEVTWQKLATPPHDCGA